MVIQDLITKLEQFDPQLPICIDDYIGFVEASEDCINVELKKYVCFPFTEADQFDYINLRGTK